jgi:hypothetical protein
MQRLQDDSWAAYRSLKLTRDYEGVLVAECHSNEGPFTFTAQDHTEFVDAFYRIAQDRANKIVILTGAGGEFIPYIDFSSFGNVADPAAWSQVHDEGVQILENIANIRVPMIAAIEGRAHVHSEYASDTRPLLMKCEKLMPSPGFSKFRPTEKETRRKAVWRMRNSLSAIDERMTVFLRVWSGTDYLHSGETTTLD